MASAAAHSERERRGPGGEKRGGERKEKEKVRREKMVVGMVE
jgi:hypothetical protein